MGNSILTISAVRVSDVRDFICQVNVDGDSEEGHTRLQVFSKMNPSCRNGSTRLRVALAHFYTKSSILNIV